MELRVLKYFLAVAQEENISAAAEFLHLTQPTLSRQLSDLEKELGKQLFVRGNRKITLTDEGLLLRKRAGEILELVEKTESELTEACETICGDIYIGAGETDAIHIIAKTAKRINADYPHIRFHLFSGNAEDVSERLDKGLLDFGILIEPADIRKYDFIRLPATDSWGVLMRKDSPLAKKAAIRPEDMWALPLITSRQTMNEGDLYYWLGRDADSLNIVTTYNLVFNASIMVEEGLGYAFSLDKLVNTSGSSPLCFRPLEPPLEVGLNVVFKKLQVFSKAAALFLSMLREQCESDS